MLYFDVAESGTIKEKMFLKLSQKIFIGSWIKKLY